MDEMTDKLKELRKTMTISEIARLVGTSEANIHRWTTDKAKMTKIYQSVVGQAIRKAKI